jgi:hypothetical protein
MGDIDAGGWVLLAVGAVGGVLATLASQAVRDAILDLVDRVVLAWWRAVAAVKRLLLVCALLLLGGLAGWAVLAWWSPTLTTQ